MVLLVCKKKEGQKMANYIFELRTPRETEVVKFSIDNLAVSEVEEVNDFVKDATIEMLDSEFFTMLNEDCNGDLKEYVKLNLEDILGRELTINFLG